VTIDDKTLAIASELKMLMQQEQVSIEVVWRDGFGILSHIGIRALLVR